LREILAVLSGNILPIFIVAGFGYGLRRWLNVDQGGLSSVVLNVFSPALVFSSLVTATISPAEMGRIGLFTVIVVIAMGLAGFLLSTLLRLSRVETVAMMLVVMFANSGNYGLTLVNLRYGDNGLSRAVVYYVTATILLYTLGIFVASSGRLSWRETIARMVRLPAVYAAVAAVVVFVFRIKIPMPIMKAVEIAGAGAIPVMLVVLGMQLADLKRGVELRLAAPAIGLRLIGGPILGVLIASIIGLSGTSRSAAIIESSMPTAVFNIILATEFGLPAPAVTSIVVLSTLISPFTVSATISLLGL